MLTVLSKVWDSVSEGVAKRFLERILGPAILFWGLGAIAYAWSRSLTSSDVFDAIQGKSLGEGIALAAVVAALLILSNAVMETLQMSILRLLEGYVPGLIKPLVEKRVETVRRRVTTLRDRWEALARTYKDHLPKEKPNTASWIESLTTIPTVPTS